MSTAKTLLPAALTAVALVGAGFGAGTSVAQPSEGERRRDVQSSDMGEMADTCARVMDEMAPQMQRMMQQMDRNGMGSMMGSSMMNGMTR